MPCPPNAWSVFPHAFSFCLTYQNMHAMLSQHCVQSYWLDVCNPNKFVIICLQDLDPWQSKVQLLLSA